MNILKRITDWRHWPFYVFYSPLFYAWLLYYAKSRSLWFFTSSNPTLAFGGFEGQRKSEIYNLLPEQFCAKSIYVKPGDDLNKILKEVTETGITYPFIVKPDIGMKGLLCRKIENEQQLQTYHEVVPVEYIIQEFIDLPKEVSVFYCRKPSEEKGVITALIQKNLPEVEGDGAATVKELILRKYNAKKWLPAIEKQLGTTMQSILKEGEILTLSHIANVYNGAVFENLPQHIDDTLLEIFDNISHKAQFYYGRYDIKCKDIEHLKKGDFVILEFNGAGSVPNHISTKDYTLRSAYKEILNHWKWMFEISKENNNQGIRYWSFSKGQRFLKNSKSYFNILKKLDKELSLAE